MTNEFDKATFSTTDDLKSAFAELASGQVQYVAADAIIGTYAAHSAGDDAYRGAHGRRAAMGVSDANTDLKQAVLRSLATLTGNGTIGVIETKWLGTALDLSSTPLTAGATGVHGRGRDRCFEGAERRDEGKARTLTGRCSCRRRHGPATR